MKDVLGFLQNPPDGPELLPLVDVALYFAAAGIPVLCLHHITPTGCSCWKAPGDCKPGKHPRTEHGLLDATCDEETIRGWWATWPYANVGLRTDGLYVIDVDPKSGGAESWADLVAAEGEPEPGMSVLTGEYGGVRGRHLYFRSDEPTRSGTDVLGPGIDLRADGGYVVAPGSLHESGVRYRIETVR